jgi:hypothetical protein
LYCQPEQPTRIRPAIITRERKPDAPSSRN